MREDRTHRFRLNREGRITETSGHLVIGLLLMLIGFLYLLDTLNVADTSRLITRGWPSVVVLIGLIRLVQARTGAARVGALIWVYLGMILQLAMLDILPFSVWGLIWPVALMGFGVYLIIRSKYGKNVPIGSNSKINSMAFMGGIERRISAQDFEGGEITAVMGGVGLDLREASIGEVAAEIEVFVWAGGVEIFVPEDWTVISKVVPIMGAFEDTTKPTADSHKRLTIRGLVLMGGIEVKNR